MKVIGKVHCITDLVSGENSNGQPWEKQTVVIEEVTTGGKPRYVSVEFMGLEKTAKTQKLQKGDLVAADFGIVCNEYKNQETGVISWFTKLDGWRIDKLSKEEEGGEHE